MLQKIKMSAVELEKLTYKETGDYISFKHFEHELFSVMHLLLPPFIVQIQFGINIEKIWVDGYGRYGG